jgi:hypothetical protein
VVQVISRRLAAEDYWADKLTVRSNSCGSLGGALALVLRKVKFLVEGTGPTTTREEQFFFHNCSRATVKNYR